jgi:hypothetical protein
MRTSLPFLAPSRGDAAGRPRTGPLPRSELPPSQETGEVRSLGSARTFVARQVNLQLPRERERRIK